MKEAGDKKTAPVGSHFPEVPGAVTFLEIESRVVAASDSREGNGKSVFGGDSVSVGEDAKSRAGTLTMAILQMTLLLSPDMELEVHPGRLISTDGISQPPLCSWLSSFSQWGAPAGAEEGEAGWGMCPVLPPYAHRPCCAALSGATVLTGFHRQHTDTCTHYLHMHTRIHAYVQAHRWLPTAAHLQHCISPAGFLDVIHISANCPFIKPLREGASVSPAPPYTCLSAHKH